MWFYLALATTVISAVSVILRKKLLGGVSPSVLTWCTLVLATPIIAVVTLKEGIPDLDSYFVIGILGSVLFYTSSSILQFRAIKKSELSAVYPLVTLGPLFTLLVSVFPPLNERPAVSAVVGVLMTLCGAYILNAGKAREDLLQPVKLLFSNRTSIVMIVSVLLESVVIIFDKLAINNTLPKNTNFVLLTENLLIIIALPPVLFMRNRNFAQQIFANKKLLIILGALNAFSSILAFSAVGEGDVGVVAAILKAQLLFVLLFSFIFFKDRPKPETVIGSIIMIIGVVLIKLGV